MSVQQRDAAVVDVHRQIGEYLSDLLLVRKILGGMAYVVELKGGEVPQVCRLLTRVDPFFQEPRALVDLTLHQEHLPQVAGEGHPCGRPGTQVAVDLDRLVDEAGAECRPPGDVSCRPGPGVVP